MAFASIGPEQRPVVAKLAVAVAISSAVVELVASFPR